MVQYDPKEIIDSIVALSTVATFIIIWLTLREMKLQRHKLFEPQVFPINFEFFVLCDYPQVILPLKFVNEKKEIEGSNDSDIHIKFKNVGQGLAKDILIEVHWNNKFKEYLEILKNELNHEGAKIDIDIDQSTCFILASEDKRILQGGNFPHETKTIHHFDYLLSVKDNDCLKIEIPSSIKLMISLSILLLEIVSNEKKPNIIKRLSEYLKVMVKINYKDNLNKIFADKFELMLSVPALELVSREYHGKIYHIAIEKKN